MKTDYETQAEKFLADTGTEYKAEFKKFGKHFEDDKDARFIFTITLTRGRRVYSFDFGSSLKDAEDVFLNLIGLGEYWNDKDWKMHFKYHARVIKDEEVLKNIIQNIIPLLNKHKDKIATPSAYDVLACLTKYDPGTFEDFCAGYGYDTDSRKAEKVYQAVQKEYQAVCSLWNEKELEVLQDIS